MPESASPQHSDRVWDRFCRHTRTIPTGLRDYSRWHRGRHKYAVWTIPIDAPRVLARYDQARDHLSPFLLTPYHRQPHITVFVCGFLRAASAYDDDYPYHRCMHHLQALKHAGIAPFDLRIGGLNSFATAPFLWVADPDHGIRRLRQVLSKTHTEIRMAPYVPHLTIGVYADAFDTRILAHQIAAFGHHAPLCQPVTQLRLTTYRAAEIAGPLTAAYTVDLDAPPCMTHPVGNQSTRDASGY